VTYQPPAGTPPAPAPICKVPKTKGMKLAVAEKAVRRADCKVGRIKKVSSRRVRSGRVTGTSPPAGRKLRAGWKVELFESKGPRS
jgi:beta-lactam-binding protein with PASTA domain